MKASRLTEAQKAFVLKQSKGGVFQPLHLYAYAQKRPTVLLDPNGEDARWYTT